MEDKVESRAVSGQYVLSPSQEMRNPGRMAQRDQERASRDFFFSARLDPAMRRGPFLSGRDARLSTASRIFRPASSARFRQWSPGSPARWTDSRVHCPELKI